MWECSWYVGSNVTTARPGPAYVSSNVCSTSLEPLAANTLAAATPCHAAIADTQRVAGAVGIAPPVDRRQGRRQVVLPPRRRRVRRLVRVEPDLDVDLGRVVAAQRPQVVAHRNEGGPLVARSRWRRYPWAVASCP